MPTNTTNRLIHIARIIQKGGRPAYLLLRQLSPHEFSWFEERDNTELPTTVSGANPQEAIKNARKHWNRDFSFRSLGCGRRYTLPERDEHGDIALFHQMCSSLNSMTGIYYDDELGHSCIVQDISSEARELFKKYEREL